MKAKKLAATLAGLGVSAALLAAPVALAQGVNPGTWYNQWVNANTSVSYYETFYAGEVAEVILDGSCDSDIDLWIYDSYGILVAKSTSNGCYEAIRFIPDYTEEYEIVVENNNKPFGSEFDLTTV
jgi:hypothetical protein